MRISRCICALLISAAAAASEADKMPVFCGVAVMADLAGPVMKGLGTRFDQMECAARLNFRDRYFPIAELGIGESTREGQKNTNIYNARAPYLRVGADYNLQKKHNGNRLMAGLRYGVCRYNYDFTNDEFADPVWTAQQPLDIAAQPVRAQWLEACLTCETKLWSFIRLGWTMRYKVRTRLAGTDYGTPYYTPGYGKVQGSTTWGGTCQIVFDLGK